MTAGAGIGAQARESESASQKSEPEEASSEHGIGRPAFGALTCPAPASGKPPDDQDGLGVTRVLPMLPCIALMFTSLSTGANQILSPVASS